MSTDDYRAKPFTVLDICLKDVAAELDANTVEKLDDNDMESIADNMRSIILRKTNFWEILKEAVKNRMSKKKKNWQGNGF